MKLQCDSNIRSIMAVGLGCSQIRHKARLLAEEMKGVSRMKDATTLDCVTNGNIGKRKSSEKWN